MHSDASKCEEDFANFVFYVNPKYFNVSQNVHTLNLTVVDDSWAAIGTRIPGNQILIPGVMTFQLGGGDVV